MRSLGFRVNRWLTWFHRWAGVVLCLLFALWFASGAVLHFVGFPALSSTARQAAGETIDVSRVGIAPSAALARVPGATDLRLVSVAGRPVYVVQAPGGVMGVAGDTGELLPAVSAALATTVAERFSGVAVAGVAGPLDYDQWIVHQHFDPFRPFYRVRLTDAAGTDLYVSARSGEVLQRTRFTQRAWNWSGAIVHWIYFTPLRQSFRAWNQVVWWVALAALSSAAVGTWLGFYRTVSNRAAGRRGLSPFRGWMRWHHVIGLFASVIVVTWILSGWLSMDHGRLFSRGEPTPQQSLRFGGVPFDVLTRTVSLEALRAAAPASEMTFGALAGETFLTAYGPGDRAPRVAFLNVAGTSAAAAVAAATLPALPDDLLLAAIRRVWPTGVPVPVTPDGRDALYRLAESTPDGAAGFEAPGDAAARIYVDRQSGRLLTVMNVSRRSYAWIYYALHTLQFPGLIAHPGLRTLLVLSLLALGLAASVTGVVLSVKRVRREFL